MPFHYDEVTFNNMKTACEEFFKSKLKDICCDILAGEQGPSSHSLEQIRDLKVIHLRNIEKTEADDSPLVEVESKEESIKLPKRRRIEPNTTI